MAPIFYLKMLKNWITYQIRLVKIGSKRGNPLFVGIGCTKLFLLFIATMALLPQKQDDEWSWRIWSFMISPSNEIGDMLAGIAGALAFLWIIVTVMLQSKELQAQREELSLTRKEIAAQSLATQEMAKSVGAQADAATLNTKRAMQGEAAALIQSLLSRLHTSLKKALSQHWTYVEKKEVRGRFDSMPGYSDEVRPRVFKDVEVSQSLFSHSAKKSRDENIKANSQYIHKRLDVLRGTSLFKSTPAKADFEIILAVLRDIAEISGRLSEADELNLIDLGVFDLHSCVEDALEADIWNEKPTPREND